MLTNRTSHTHKMRAHYDSLYSAENEFWGQDPSPLSLLTLQHCKSGKILDIGCGQGPDAIFFARKGFIVNAIDISPIAIEHLQKKIIELKIKDISAKTCDMQNLHSLEDNYNIIFSRMSLQMIPETERETYIESLKNKYPKAFHIHIIPIDGELSAQFGTEFICKKDLLKNAYAGWNIIFSNDTWAISRSRNKDGEPYLMRESWIIAKKK